MEAYMRVNGEWCRSDEGKIFVLTALGKDECASYKHKEIGKPVSEYADECVLWNIQKGYLKEVNDPDWIECQGWRAVYNHKGHVIDASNYRVFHDKEMAELAAKAHDNQPWRKADDPKAYVIEAQYKGKKPIPCRQYEGKPVYNWSYWTYDRPIGSWVEEEIVDDLMNCLPPLSMRRDCMQTSEPTTSRYDEKNDKWRNTYTTFKKVVDGIYEYCGDCFKGENVQRGKEMVYV